MRKLTIILLFMFFIMLPIAVSAESTATDEDYKVLEVAFTAFMNNATGDDSILQADEVGLICLIKQTEEHVGMISQNQIDRELEQHQKSLSTELGNALRARNTESVSLSGFRPQLSNIMIFEEDELPSLSSSRTPKDTDKFYKFWEDKAWIQTWLPGYSKDGNIAVVRFWFGPTPHGAIATYFLKKEGDQWVVDWFHHAYYV